MKTYFGLLQKQETDEYLNDLFPARVRSMKTTTKPLTSCFEELVKRGRESKPDIFTSAAMRIRYGRSSVLYYQSVLNQKTTSKRK